jgi:hypothetical protein
MIPEVGAPELAQRRVLTRQATEICPWNTKESDRKWVKVVVGDSSRAKRSLSFNGTFYAPHRHSSIAGGMRWPFWSVKEQQQHRPFRERCKLKLAEVEIFPVWQHAKEAFFVKTSLYINYQRAHSMPVKLNWIYTPYGPCTTQQIKPQRLMHDYVTEKFIFFRLIRCLRLRLYRYSTGVGQPNCAKARSVRFNLGAVVEGVANGWDRTSRGVISGRSDSIGCPYRV